MKLHSDFGTPAYKLRRGGAADTSVAASESVDTTNLERMVYEAIKAAGSRGMTADEMIAMFGESMPYSSITARPSALIRKGLVKDSGYKGVTRSGRKAIKWQIDWEGYKNANDQ